MPYQSVPPSSFLTGAIERERQLTRDHEARLAEATDEPAVFPEPDDRPSQRAQWDEIHGRWIEWDEATDTWDVVEDVYRSDGRATDATVVAEAADDSTPDGPVWLPGADQSLDDIE
jgi:hypothetical protein